MRSRPEMWSAAECAAHAQETVWEDISTPNRPEHPKRWSRDEAEKYAEGFEDGLRYALASIGVNETMGTRWIFGHMDRVIADKDQEARQ